MPNQENVYSYHTFLFPFEWDFHSKGKEFLNSTFEERTDLGSIRRLMQSAPNNKKWESFEFKMQVNEDQYHTFNEYNYFHSYARRVLSLGLNKDNEILQYRYNLSEDALYKIEVQLSKEQGEGTKEYELSLKKCLLNFYKSGVGFISFHLENTRYNETQDVLIINDYGRRIYPPFLGSDDTVIAAAFESGFPISISLENVAEETIKEDFTYYNDKAQLSANPIQLPRYIAHLLGKNFKIREEQIHHKYQSVLLRPIIDDRMYVLCYLFSNHKMKQLKSYNEEDGVYGYSKDSFWYTYLFVDSGTSSCKSKTMRKKLLNKHTYDRWIEQHDAQKNEDQGVLFGVSRYSFMMLVDDCDFSRYILPNHFRYLYCQMAALGLMQRASILRFSNEAANIVKQLNNETSSDKIKDFYKSYLNFINQIYFREISPQEQGIELYAMIRSVMDIDNNVNDLKSEIGELYNYAMIFEGNNQSKESTNLTWIATACLPATLVAAIFGFSNLQTNDINVINFWPSLFATIVVIILSLLFLLFFKRIRKRISNFYNND